MATPALNAQWNLGLPVLSKQMLAVSGVLLTPINPSVTNITPASVRLNWEQG